MFTRGDLDRAVGAEPAAGFGDAAQHAFVAVREDRKQIPRLNRVQLHRGGGGEQHAFGLLADLAEEAHQLVGLCPLIHLRLAGIRLGSVAAPGPVGFVDDHAGVALVQQLADRLRHPAHDQSLRHQADAARALAERRHPF